MITRNPACRPIALLVAGFAIISLAVACGGDDNEEPTIGCSRGVQGVVVSLPMFAEMACTTGGEHVVVTGLIPWDADPHTFLPPDERAEDIKIARLVLYNDQGIDEPTKQFIFEHGRGSAQILAIPRSVDSPTAPPPPEGEPATDALTAGDPPYLWLDPAFARVYIDAIRDSLEIIDPDHIQDYRTNAEQYIALIDQLDRDLQTAVDTIPAENRKLATTFDSMTHLARRYGFEVVGHLSDYADLDAPTPATSEIEALADAVRAANAPAVFAERGYDDSAMRRVAESAGVPLCHLYTDRVDEAAYTYLDMMRANLSELTGCLGGATTGPS